MAEIESTDNLCINLPNEFLANVIVCLDTTFDYLLQVTALAILHNYVNLKVALVHYSVVIAHDVGML